MKNKRFLLTLLFVLITGLMVAACGRKNTETPGTSLPAQSQPAETVNDLDIQVGVGQRGDYEDETTPKESEAATEPQETVAETTEPAQTQPQETRPQESKPAEEQTGSDLAVSYAQYQAMTEEEQEAFVESFPTMSDFVDWWNAAQAAQEKDEPVILDGNTVDLGNLIP